MGSSSDGRYRTWLERNPSHPGRHIYHGCLERVEGVSEGLTVSAAARQLGISRVQLSRVLNGRSGITVSLALRLEAQGWGAAEAWMGLQAAYDIAQARNRTGQWPERPTRSRAARPESRLPSAIAAVESS